MLHMQVCFYVRRLACLQRGDKMQRAWSALISVSTCAEVVWSVLLAAEAAITETNLQKGQISHDLEVVLIKPQSILVALDGLTVVSVCSV